MSNMSYCRFHNTKIDMEDCLEALEERDITSKEEKRAAEWMFQKILDFCESEGIIEGYNIDRLVEIVQECGEQEEEDEE